MLLDPQLQQREPALWQHLQDVYAMRIRLTHHYHRVDASVVYATLQIHLPLFEAMVRRFASGHPGAADASAR